MSDPTVDAPALAQQIVALGREGLSRAEIAVGLGLDEPALRRLADQHPALAAALVRAETEARAWWDRQAREAVTKDGQFHPAAWIKAMAQRYGSQSHRPRPNAKADTVRPIPPWELDEDPVRFDIPDNGKERRRRG